MTAQQLKNSILQLAVQGKLVPQNPDDEPASVLLERIRAEKQALIKQGKIKKDKKKSDVIKTEEIPFDIPDSWCWCRLDDVLLKLTDGTHSTPKYIEKGVPFISVKDVSTGRLNFSNCKHISENEHNELYERCNAEFGDILLTKVGTTGIPVIVDTNKQFSLFVSVALLKFNQKLLYNKYLLYMINSPLVQKQAAENTKGVGNKNWVMRDIANTLIVIPPLAEQKRIVSKIEEILPYIEAYEKAETQLTALNKSFPEMLKKSILQEAVQGKLVPQDHDDEPASVLLERIKSEKQKLIKQGKIKKDKKNSDVIKSKDLPFDIPDSWEWCRLGTIFQHNTGKALNSSNSQGTKMQYITTSNLYWNRFELDNLKEMLFTESEIEKCTVTKGDLLVCEGGDIGRASIWNYDYPMRIQNHIHRLRPYATVDMYFFYYIFYLYKRAGLIGGKGIGIQGLSSNAIDKLIIPLPPLEEQKRIVAKIEELMKYCDML